ncbi:hypothetical protein [Rhodococcus sp. IEGM 1330]|uniref:hypothetical protein n=1 Tax=Rhodococcus sp. IEGM 1330 TaxID=3082225 RepID=UPI00295375D4|nr:hypothetical protein [Rhodococcus sp. IEGM 1330]MDV8025341.1 hypothetical protein [Rhodococcus sp. IEGM 1330]
MNDDNDEPKKPLLYQRLWNKIQASMGFSVFCAVLLVLLISLWVIGNYWDEGWKAEQWGPVASWVASLATFLAVGVALYQTKLARDDAAQAKLDAAVQIANDEKRHTDQLAAASDRLTSQLDAQRKSRQVEALYHVYRDEQILESVYDALINAIGQARRINNPEHKLQKAVVTLIDGLRGDRAEYRASMAEANFVVSDFASREVLKEMQDKEHGLNDQIEALAREVTTTYQYDIDSVTSAQNSVSELVDLRETLIETARELSGVIPLGRVEDGTA